jgi:hypothetical protein
MANYCKSYYTWFEYPAFELTTEQKSVLDKWYGYDFSYVNMNRPDEFVQMAKNFNEVSIPYFYVEFWAIDEYNEKWWVCYNEETNVWEAYFEYELQK